MSLTPEQLARGVTGVSAGNHAISLAYSARELGAEVVLVETVHEAFETARAIERDEGRTFVHPYEGPLTALGTATVGLEFIEQTRANGVELDAVVVAAGGGGLTGGVACAVKLLAPAAQLFVVEPEGADTMHRSFRFATRCGCSIAAPSWSPNPPVRRRWQRWWGHCVTGSPASRWAWWCAAAMWTRPPSVRCWRSSGTARRRHGVAETRSTSNG